MAGPKKKGGELSENVQSLIDLTAAGMLEVPPSRNPAEVFNGACSGLPGREYDLIEALTRIKTPATLNFLYRLSSSLKDKPLIKAARKAIYRLEQAGLKADDQARDKGAPLVRPPEARRPIGYLSTYDPSGQRMGLLAWPGQPTGYDTGFFAIDQTRGLPNFNLGHVTSNGLKRINDQIREQPYYKRLVEVPVAAVRFALAEAAGLGLNLDERDLEDYEYFLTLAGAVPVPERPLIYDLIPEASQELNHSVAIGRKIMEHEFLNRSLILGPEDLEPYWSKFEEVDQGVLVLTPDQKEEQRLAIIERAGREIFAPDRIRKLKRQLEEIGLLLWQVGEKDLAHGALAVARGLAAEPESAAGHPFIQEIIRRTCDFLDKADKKDEDEGKEGERTSPEGFRLSESGLLVPENILD
ncbi:MAG: hypothetical protein AB1641_26330 [Thermodesulfobacteriota bacterium]